MKKIRPIHLLFGLPLAWLGWLAVSPQARQYIMKPTTERDGVGKVLLRRYFIDVKEARLAPEQVVQAVLDDFPKLLPKPLATTFKVRGQPGKGRLGDLYLILMLVRPGLVSTELLEPLRFRNRTHRLHAESGWVEFSAIPLEGERGHNYRLQIRVSVRTSTPFDHFAYRLGMANAQSKNWEVVLHKAAELSGGTLVNEGRETNEFDFVPGGIIAPGATA